jgi:hypothetical protein
LKKTFLSFYRLEVDGPHVHEAKIAFRFFLKMRNLHFEHAMIQLKLALFMKKSDDNLYLPIDLLLRRSVFIRFFQSRSKIAPKKKSRRFCILLLKVWSREVDVIPRLPISKTCFPRFKLKCHFAILEISEFRKTRCETGVNCLSFFFMILLKKCAL